MDRRTDSELMVAIRLDNTALEELYRRHRAAVLRFAARRVRTPDEVVDLVGAIWLEVIASLDRFDPSRGDALSWMLGIAANLGASERRRQMRERQIVQRLGGHRPLDEDDFTRLEHELDAASAYRGLLAALESLPPSERAVAELVLVDELTPSQAARALEIRPAALRMRLTRARRKLRAAADKAEMTTSAQALKEASS
jgi:RNA polymerase sigma factor (sigma-70 family)